MRFRMRMSFGKAVMYVWMLGSTYVMLVSALHSHKGVIWFLFGICAIVSLMLTLAFFTAPTINKPDEDSSSQPLNASR